MGVRPILGRTFIADEDRPGNDRVVVLSHRLWTRRFGASESAVGRELRMNGAAYRIAGVMPASFDLTSDSEELWTPIAFTPAQRAMHDEHYLSVYGRLKPGVTRQQVQGKLDAVAMRLRHDFPKDDETVSFGTVPFEELFVGDYRQRLLTLLAAVGLAERGVAETEAESKRRIAAVMRSVGERLGNTPAVARASYVSPAVIEQYLDGRTIDDFRPRHLRVVGARDLGLDPEERAVLSLLRSWRIRRAREAA